MSGLGGKLGLQRFQIGTLLNQIFTDNFDRADGDLANDWLYNGSWLISSNKLVANPAVTGANLVTNGDFEVGDPPTGWTPAASNSIAQDADVRPGSAGTKSALVTVDGSVNAVSKLFFYTAGKFYRFNFWGKRGTSNEFGFNPIERKYFNNTEWEEKRIGSLLTASASTSYLLATSGTAYFDDIDSKQLTTNQLFSVRDYKSGNIDISVNLTYSGNEIGGIVLCVDDVINPTDYILIGLDSYMLSTSSILYQLKIVKVIGGVFSLIKSTVIGANTGLVRVSKNGAAIKTYFDGKQIDEDYFVSDAGIVDNIKHGLFSTGNSFLFNDFTSSERITNVIESPVFTRTSQADLYTASGSHDWLGWPWMCKAANGIWMMSYRAATAHNGTDTTARMHIRFSNDEGATWTNEDVYIGGAAVTGWPMAGHSGVSSVGSGMFIPCANGDILCHVYEFYLGTYQWRSIDNGATWADEGLINSDVRIISIDDFVIDGTDIYININYTLNTGDAWINKVMKSSDNGATWTVQGTYETDSDEAGLIIAPNGNMIVIMRDPDVAATYKYVSTDKGVTWGAKTLMPEIGILQRPKMKLDGDGVLLFGREKYIGTDSQNEVIYYSDDNCITFKRKFKPDISTALDGSYSDYIIKDDGSYYMISYKGIKTAAGIRKLIFTKA